MRVAGARPQPALIDQRQQPGVHQRRLAGAGVAVDLEPAHDRGAAPRIEAGEGIERLLLPAEEQMRLIDALGRQADERATVEADRVVGDEAALADLLDQALRQRIGAVPGRRLEQSEKRR